jgi:hypothetical protein
MILFPVRYLLWFGPYRPGEIISLRVEVRDPFPVRYLAFDSVPSWRLKPLRGLLPSIAITCDLCSWAISCFWFPTWRNNKPRGLLMIPFPERHLAFWFILTWELLSLEADFFASHLWFLPVERFHLAFDSALPAEYQASRLLMTPVPERYLAFDSVPIWELLSLEADYFALTYDSVPGAISILLLIQSLPADNKPRGLLMIPFPERYLCFWFSPIWRITKPRGWLLLHSLMIPFPERYLSCLWIHSLPAEIISLRGLLMIPFLSDIVLSFSPRRNYYSMSLLFIIS